MMENIAATQDGGAICNTLFTHSPTQSLVILVCKPWVPGLSCISIPFELTTTSASLESSCSCSLSPMKLTLHSTSVKQRYNVCSGQKCEAVYKFKVRRSDDYVAHTQRLSNIEEVDVIVNVRQHIKTCRLQCSLKTEKKLCGCHSDKRKQMQIL